MVPHYTDVVERVIADPASLGIAALNRVSPEVKVLGLVGNNGTRPSRASAADAIAGKYPYDRYLYIYVRSAPGKPIDPFVKEYLHLVLSKEGQEAISSETLGYLPLNANEIAEELGKLEE